MKKVDIVKFDKIVKSGKISLYSPSLLIAKELKLKYLIVEEGNITGPAVGTSIMVDKITRNLKIEKMLDLCCGSGALTKIAIKNGVKNVVCVDKNLKAAKYNLKDVKGEVVKFMKKDVFKLKCYDFYDLVVFDPPRYLIEKVINKFDFSSINSDLFVLWYGSSSEEEWCRYVSSVLKNFFTKLYSFSIYGEEIYICSNSQTGMKKLEDIYRKW